MRCCRPPAAFDWLPRLLEIGIRELWIHPRSSPLHCSVDNVSGDFPPLPYPITRPCPVRQTLYAIHSPPLDPQHSVLVKYSSLIFFKPPICSSSSQGHRVILWFNRGTEFLFMNYQTSCSWQQAFIKKSRIQTPLRKKTILLFCEFLVNVTSTSSNSILIHVLYFLIQLKSPGSHTLIYWTWFYIPKLSMSL